MTGDRDMAPPQSVHVAVRGLRRWALVIVSATALSFVLAVLVLGAGVSTFSSSVSLEFTDDVSTIVNTRNKATDARSEIEAEIRLLGSSENLALLREAMGPAGIEVKILKVSGVEGAPIITVSAVSTTADSARVAAQLAVDRYLQFRLAAEVDEQTLQLGPLREQREEQLALIAALSAELEAIRETASLSEISAFERRTANALDRLDTYNIAIQEGEFYAQTADGDARIVTLATAPVESTSDNLLKAIQVALSVLVVLLIAAHHLQKTRGPMLLVEEVVSLAGPSLPVLAVVPRFKHSLRKGSASLVVRSNVTSPAAEAFRYLRASIELGLRGQDRSSIAFTSAEHAEGNSVTIANYALAAANAGMDLVLVDADFQNASVARLFGVPAEDDFARVMTGDYRSLENPVLMNTSGRPLALITSTPATAADRLEFTSDAVGVAIEKIGTEFSVVALDCPPVLRVSDARTVAVAADHAVLVVRLGRTSKASLAAAIGLLEQSGASLLGIVVTHSADRSSTYGKYDYTQTTATTSS